MFLFLCRLLTSYLVRVCAVLGACVLGSGHMIPAVSAEGARGSPPELRLDEPIVLTQVPTGPNFEKAEPAAGGMLRALSGDGARILVVSPDSSVRVLSDGFYGACEADVSFDGTRILFAGKRTADDNWNIYEMGVDGSGVRQITQDTGNCRHPVYLSTLYTIVSPRPWYQLAFVSDLAGTVNEQGPTPATHLYTCKLDGSALRRLTFNLSSDFDPCLMSDGRLLFASWQRSNLHRGIRGRIGLHAVNIDGTDRSLFAGEQTRRIRHMPCETADGRVIFVEADWAEWDGAGRLAAVRIRRPLHSYRPLTQPDQGLFHTPAALPDGSLLVSRRARDGGDTLGVYRLDLASGELQLLFDDPHFHEVQARIIRSHPVPDGRSSVVTEKDPHGRLYCLNVYNSDVRRECLPAGTVARLRVLEGIPLRAEDWPQDLAAAPESSAGFTIHGLPPLARRRMLGEIDVQPDGSFNIEVPANTHIELQILDRDGMALRTCTWIWAKNHEPRGCIGCHEDPELTPENLFMNALAGPSTPLTLPPARRRTVDFRRDVMPIIAAKCLPCHRQDGSPPRLDGGPPRRDGGERFVARNLADNFNQAYIALLATEGSGDASAYRYVHPGRARTSPLIWHLFGRNTSRPWDETAVSEKVKLIPPGESVPLTADERRTFVEWIDMGALWDGAGGPPGNAVQDSARRRTATAGGS